MARNVGPGIGEVKGSFGKVPFVQAREPEFGSPECIMTCICNHSAEGQEEWVQKQADTWCLLCNYTSRTYGLEFSERLCVRKWDGGRHTGLASGLHIHLTKTKFEQSVTILMHSWNDFFFFQYVCSRLRKNHCVIFIIVCCLSNWSSPRSSQWISFPS